MIDLLEYGFIEAKKTSNYTEYHGHGFRVTVYDYLRKTFDESEINIRTFVVDTQQTSSAPHPLDELEQWLKNKNINKK
jgi:hypothetical protein